MGVKRWGSKYLPRTLRVLKLHGLALDSIRIPSAAEAQWGRRLGLSGEKSCRTTPTSDSLKCRTPISGDECPVDPEFERNKIVDGRVSPLWGTLSALEHLELEFEQRPSGNYSGGGTLDISHLLNAPRLRSLFLSLSSHAADAGDLVPFVPFHRFPVVAGVVSLLSGSTTGTVELRFSNGVVARCHPHSRSPTVSSPQ